jgi:hypothetical protein
LLHLALAVDIDKDQIEGLVANEAGIIIKISAIADKTNIVKISGV